MGDWFEIRFRDAEEDGRLDPAFAARVRGLVVHEWGASSASRAARNADHDHETDDDRNHDEGELIMLETEDRPTTEATEPPSRRPPGRWLLMAAVVMVVAAIGGALLVDGDDRDVDTATSAPASGPGSGSALDAPAEEVPQIEEFVPLEVGRWYVDPDGDAATPLRVSFDIPAEGWVSWLGAANFSGESHIALSTMTVDNLAVDACTDHSPRDPAVGPTVDDLATALTQLPPFEVTSPPSAVTVLGYAGTHLQLTVPDIPLMSERGNSGFADCTEGNLVSWYSPLHDRGTSPFYGYNGEPGRTEDFWILDVDGTRLVLSATYGPGSQDDDVDELAMIIDSIRIDP